MKDRKPFWTSWTLWSAVATLVGVLLPGLGINVEPTKVTAFFQSFQQALDSILTFGGLAMVAFSRFTATQELTATRR